MITSAEWNDKLNEVKLRKDDMNRLIMNFLVTEVSLARLIVDSHSNQQHPLQNCRLIKINK